MTRRTSRRPGGGVDLFAAARQPHAAEPLVGPLLRRHNLPVVSLMEDVRLTGEDHPVKLRRFKASLRLAREIDPATRLRSKRLAAARP